MADISKIKLNNIDYDIKDAVARQMITGGLAFNIVWTSDDYVKSSTPSAGVLGHIPAGVKVKYNDGASEATGTLTATDGSGNPRLGFYLVYRRSDSATSSFDEYAVAKSPDLNYYWEKIGSTTLELKGLVTDVTLNRSAEATVFTTGTTFTGADSSVTASGTQTADAISSVSSTTRFLSLTSVPSSAISNVQLGANTTFNTDAVKCTYANETLTIAAATAAKVTLTVTPASTTTVATGDLSAEASGAGAGVVSSVSSSTGSYVTSLGTLTAAGQTVTADQQHTADVLTTGTTLNVIKHS